MKSWLEFHHRYGAGPRKRQLRLQPNAVPITYDYKPRFGTNHWDQ